MRQWPWLVLNRKVGGLGQPGETLPGCPNPPHFLGPTLSRESVGSRFSVPRRRGASQSAARQVLCRETAPQTDVKHPGGPDASHLNPNGSHIPHRPGGTFFFLCPLRTRSIRTGRCCRFRLLTPRNKERATLGMLVISWRKHPIQRQATVQSTRRSGGAVAWRLEIV